MLNKCWTKEISQLCNPNTSRCLTTSSSHPRNEKGRNINSSRWRKPAMRSWTFPSFVARCSELPSSCQKRPITSATLNWCSARSSVSEGVFLMYPWRETDSMSTYSSAILFPSTSLLFNHWIVFHCTSGYVAILLCIHWLKLLISTVRSWKCILAQNIYPKEPHICIQLWSTGLIPVWLGILG